LKPFTLKLFKQSLVKANTVTSKMTSKTLMATPLMLEN